MLNVNEIIDKFKKQSKDNYIIKGEDYFNRKVISFFIDKDIEDIKELMESYKNNKPVILDKEEINVASVLKSWNNPLFCLRFTFGYSLLKDTI